MCDKENYATASFKEYDKDYFKIDEDPKKALECQAKALRFLADLEDRLYEFLEYSSNYNKDKKEAVTKSLANITMILHPQLNTFLNTYAYSGAFNVSYLELRGKVGKLIVKKLLAPAVGDVVYTTYGDADKEFKAEADKQAFK